MRFSNRIWFFTRDTGRFFERSVTTIQRLFRMRSFNKEFRVTSVAPDFHVPLVEEVTTRNLNRVETSTECKQSMTTNLALQAQCTEDQSVVLVAREDDSSGNKETSEPICETEGQLWQENTSQGLVSSASQKPLRTATSDQLENDEQVFTDHSGNSLCKDSAKLLKYMTVTELESQKELWTSIFEHVESSMSFDQWMLKVRQSIQSLAGCEIETTWSNVGSNVFQGQTNFEDKYCHTANMFGPVRENGPESPLAESDIDLEVKTNSPENSGLDQHDCLRSIASPHAQVTSKWVRAKSIDISSENYALRVAMLEPLNANDRFEDLSSDVLQGTHGDNMTLVNSEHGLSIESSVHEIDMDLAIPTTPIDMEDVMFQAINPYEVECQDLADYDTRLESLYASVEESDSREIPEWIF